MEKWLDDNDVLIYSAHNEFKSIVTERFVRNLNGQINKEI